SDGPIVDVDSAVKLSKKIGFPIILKASAGGGGRGMRVVNDDSELPVSFHIAQREALTAFGNGELYMERYLPKIRHIEAQILVDQKGEVLFLGERDCSIQRRHQKLIEEAPSPMSTDSLRKRLGDYAVKAAKALKYCNAGTIEFIVDDNLNIYFMEVNTRVQVEHPITEEVTGIDIIKEQIKIAAGIHLSVRQNKVKIEGHAIECRINAEDPIRFTPSPGKIKSLVLPGGPGVRIDTAIYEGYTVPPYYDSLIAKLICKGKDRQEAISKMARALDEFKIEGIKTTIPFLKSVIEHPSFIKGDYYTDFVSTNFL
ncbi:MAG: ATP-grasp domain-containing protein, partial [Thermodesulfovibrionales bacterium]